MAARTALGVLAGDEHVLDDVDDARGLAVGAELEGGVGEALRREQVALVGADQADADDAPVAAGLRHRLGDVDGAVGAEEGAEAEVDDADAGAGPAAGQARGVSGQAGLRRWGRPWRHERAGARSQRRMRAGGALAARTPALLQVLEQGAKRRRSQDIEVPAVRVSGQASLRRRAGWCRGCSARGEARKTAAPAMSDGLAPAAGGDAVEDRLVAVGVGAQGLGVVGLDVAGGDGVDVDAAGRPLVGEELGQAGDAVLGGGVGGDADAALEGEQRGDVDDGAAGLRVRRRRGRRPGRGRRRP